MTGHNARAADLAMTTPLSYADCAAALNAIEGHPNAETALDFGLASLRALGWRGRLEEHVRAFISWRATLAECKAECEAT